MEYYSIDSLTQITVNRQMLPTVKHLLPWLQALDTADFQQQISLDFKIYLYI